MKYFVSMKASSDKQDSPALFPSGRGAAADEKGKTDGQDSLVFHPSICDAMTDGGERTVEPYAKAGGAFVRACCDISPLAEDFKVYILWLLQCYVGEATILESIRLEGHFEKCTFDSEWGKIIISRTADSNPDLDTFHFEVPLTFFARRFKQTRRGKKDGGSQYAQMRDAFAELKKAEFRMVAAGKRGYELFSGILNSCTIEPPWYFNGQRKIRRRNACVHFGMDRPVIKAMFADHVGICKWYVDDVIALKSIYAKRFYEIFASIPQGRTLLFHFSSLKKMFGLEDKYSQFGNFNLRVLKPAIAAINKNTRLELNAELVRDGIVSRTDSQLIRFTVHHNGLISKDVLMAIEHPAYPAGRLLNFLEKTVGMKDSEIRNNSLLLSRLEMIPGVFDDIWLRWEWACEKFPQQSRDDPEIIRKARIRYLIGAFKGIVNDRLDKPGPPQKT